MKVQTIQFTTATKDGEVKKVGKSTIVQPKPKCKEDSIKWYTDTKKTNK